MADTREHLSIVICGHVDSGKSTTTGRLLFDLGGLPERELEKLKQEAERLGKASFAFAFFMDRQKEERERGGLQHVLAVGPELDEEGAERGHEACRAAAVGVGVLRGSLTYLMTVRK